MNAKKRAAAFLFSASILVYGTGAFAASPIAYADFVTNTLVPWIGVCDTAKKLTSGQEAGTAYPGILSVSRADLDGDGAEELIVVEERRISVYGRNQSGIDLWDTLDTDLISDAETSYSNIFFYTVPGEEKKCYLGIEKAEANGAEKAYELKLVTLEHAKLTQQARVWRASGAEGLQEEVSVKGTPVYSQLGDAELTTRYDPENYLNIFAAAGQVLAEAGIVPEQFIFSQDRLWFDETEEQMKELTGLTAKETGALKAGKSSRITERLTDAEGITYITTAGIGSDKPKVQIEDISELKTLSAWKKGITVEINGQTLELDQEPVIQEGHTLVPVRGIFQALDAEVSWLPAGQKVIVNTANINVTMQIGKREYYVNGIKKKLDIAPQLIQGKTMVPARAVSEALGAEVDWDASTQTVIITTEQP